MDTIISVKLILASLVIATHASTLEPCPKCGNAEVPLPLSTSAGCGHPSYRLHCSESGALEFPSAGGFRYKVLSIDAGARRLTISPPRVRAGECYSPDFPLQGLRLDERLPFNISARNTVMLLNCSAALLRSPLNCSAASLCRQFEEGAPEGSACRGRLCCHYLKDSTMSSHFIRVRDGGCTAYTCVVDLKSGAPLDQWNYGIELQWLPLPPN